MAVIRNTPAHLAYFALNHVGDALYYLQCAQWPGARCNRAAREAVERVRACVGSGAPRRAVNPLLLHGPPGTGKTHLVDELLTSLMRQLPDLPVYVDSPMAVRATEVFRSHPECFRRQVIP